MHGYRNRAACACATQWWLTICSIVITSKNVWSFQWIKLKLCLRDTDRHSEIERDREWGIPLLSIGNVWFSTVRWYLFIWTLLAFLERKKNNYWHTFWLFAYCVKWNINGVHMFLCVMYQSIFITLNTQCHVQSCDQFLSKQKEADNNRASSVTCANVNLLQNYKYTSYTLRRVYIVDTFHWWATMGIKLRWRTVCVNERKCRRTAECTFTYVRIRCMPSMQCLINSMMKSHCRWLQGE